MQFNPELALKALELAVQGNSTSYTTLDLARQYYYFLTGNFSRHPSEVTNTAQEV